MKITVNEIEKTVVIKAKVLTVEISPELAKLIMSKISDVYLPDVPDVSRELCDFYNALQNALE